METQDNEEVEWDEHGQKDNLYYKTYTGPELTAANIDGEDVTQRIRELYGEKCNWCEKLYSVRSLNLSECIGKLLHMEFDRRNPHVPEFTTMMLKTLDTAINPPLFMPCAVTNNNSV